MLAIVERRDMRESGAFGSQPLELWHGKIGERALAYAILDRAVHNACHIELKGESMRKRNTPPSPAGS